MTLIDELKNFQPFNAQEAIDKEIILEHLLKDEAIFSRDNLSLHVTASAWVLNKSRDKLLMIHHNLYNSWAWMGGHADNEKNLLHVAIKEVQEESGVKEVRPISSDIFSVEVLTVDGHEKNKHYVPSHLHLNITYLLEADDRENLVVKEDENSDVAWFSLEDSIKVSNEPWFQERIYKKLNAKLAEKKIV